MIRYSEQRALLARYGKEQRNIIIKESFDSTVIPDEVKPGTYSAGLLYLDIASFSTRIANWKPEEIKRYLDEYYAYVLPIIDEYYGRIDRIMGDGIIAVFARALHGKLAQGEEGEAAVTAAKAAVSAVSGSKFSSKAAVTSGDLVLCRIGVPGIYDEVTVIGTPLTEVHRMENIADEDQVIVTASTTAGDCVTAYTVPHIATYPKWTVDDRPAEPLKGLGKVNLKVLKYVAAPS